MPRINLLGAECYFFNCFMGVAEPSVFLEIVEKIVQLTLDLMPSTSITKFLLLGWITYINHFGYRNSAHNELKSMSRGFRYNES